MGDYATWKNRGSMLIDSLFGFVVCFICGLFIMPIYIEMQQYEDEMQARVHASQVLFNGAYQLKLQHRTSGEQTIEGRDFSWYFDGQQLCVDYLLYEEEEQLCASKTSAASR